MDENGVAYLKDVYEWEEVATASDRELVVFKVSPICEISHAAEAEFDAWYARVASTASFSVCKVDVIAARAVSQRIAEALDVQHKSPQILWLNADRSVKWHASHNRITQESLEAQRRNGEGAASGQ